MNAHDVTADLDPKHGVFVNGRGLGTASMFEVHDPATREVIAEISDGTASEATSAVEAAARAFAEWAATAPRVRAEILRRAFNLMVANTDRLVALICAENGKPQADARAEVAYAAEFLRWNIFPWRASGEIVGVAIYEERLTQQMRLLAEAQSARESAESASRIKSEFLAEVSTELKTPGAGIIGLADILLETETNKQRREYLEMIKTSTGSWLKLAGEPKR